MDGKCTCCGEQLTKRNTARQDALGVDGFELCDQCATPDKYAPERKAWDAARYWIGFPGGMPKRR